MTLTIGRKVLGLSVITGLLTVAVAGAAYWGMSSLSGATATMLANEAKIAEHSARARANVLGLRRFEKDIFLNIKDAKRVEEYTKKLADEQDRLAKRLDALRTVAQLPEDKERVARMTANLETYAAGMTGILARIKAGEITTPEDGNKAVGQYKEPIHQLEKTAQDFATDGNTRMAQMEAAFAATARRTTWTTIGLSLVAIVTGAGLSLAIGRSITRPLTTMVARLKDIAEGDGDLTKRVDITRRDEIGETAHWFNVFVARVHDIMTQVKDAAGHAASAANQLSAASTQLAGGVQAQAASLEETAASLEEITGTVKQNADNARQANQLAVGSRDVAEQGGQVVANAVHSMGEINKASKKIADIITTIDEIAFQTNLLALNAAVEAARAGEQGRGFAVVAAEVRNLAQRSATAAKEIKGLIQDSVQKVDGGSALVNKSGETLNEIVSSVKRVTDIIAEIAAASGEQTSGIDQVNRAVAQMDQVTQSNAAQTEELSSTAQALAAQAEELQALVGRFELGEARTPRARAEAPRPAPAPTRAIAKPAPAKPASIPSPASRLVPARPAMAPATAANGHATNGHARPHAKDDGFEEF